jgi:hypothetical protein
MINQKPIMIIIVYTREVAPLTPVIEIKTILAKSLLIIPKNSVEISPISNKKKVDIQVRQVISMTTIPTDINVISHKEHKIRIRVMIKMNMKKRILTKTRIEMIMNQKIGNSIGKTHKTVNLDNNIIGIKIRIMEIKINRDTLNKLKI